MSDALDYLMKVRPEAMQSYFAFLRAAGTRLDPRTRALISVITKVDRQTEAGLRQYVTRALREGIMADMRKSEFYDKPSVRRRRKANRARRRRMRQLSELEGKA